MTSRTLPCFVILACVAASAFAVGCRKEEPQAPTSGFVPAATTTAAPTVAPVATAAPVGTVQPGPFAPACTILEGTCGYARCNMQVGKCSWPCGSNNDCVAGSTCIGAGTALGTCGPSFGAPPTQLRGLTRRNGPRAMCSSGRRAARLAQSRRMGGGRAVVVPVAVVVVVGTVRMGGGAVVVTGGATVVVAVGGTVVVAVAVAVVFGGT